MGARRAEFVPVARLASERGHAPPAVVSLVGAIGAVLLGIGAANDTGALAIAGAIVLAVGLVATVVVHHVAIEWGIMSRLDRIEK